MEIGGSTENLHFFYLSKKFELTKKKNFDIIYIQKLKNKHAVCPGGEGAVLKTVGCNSFAGSNPVHGATKN